MTTEKQKILEMLENGKITAAEATSLIDALENGANVKPTTELTSVKSGGKGKKLRVKVDGNVETGQKIKVDVAVPLVLGRMIDGILENCVPTVAQDELKKQGIDLSSIRIGELLDAMGDSDEDITNVDIDNDEVKMKVRVYVD